jgi:hypothetical protein
MVGMDEAVDAALADDALAGATVLDRRAATGSAGACPVCRGAIEAWATSVFGVESAVVRPPLVETWRSEPSDVTVRLPSRSVRSTWAPIVSRRLIVSGLGCP